MKKLAVLFIALFSMAALVSAQSKQRVAVLPSVGDLDPQRLILLTDKVREIATKNLPMENFNILKQDVITKLIGEEELYRSCKEGVCIGDLAKKTDANYGARCDVVRLDDGLVMKFELYSVNEEAIFETFTDYNVKDFHGMLSVLEARLPATFQKMVYKTVYDKALADARDKALEQQRQENALPKPIVPQPMFVPEPTPTPAAVSHTEPEPPKIEPRAEPEPQEKQYSKYRSMQKRISFEIGGAFAPFSYYNKEYEDGESKEGSSMGGGPYMRIDFIYVEIILPDGVFTGEGPRGEVAVILKYPIVYEIVNMTPILGFGLLGSPGVGAGLGPSPIFGGKIDVAISEIAYLHSEYLCRVSMYGEGYVTSFKVGGGLDIGLGERKKTYLRGALLYNWMDGSGHNTLHNVDLRLGIGYKWGGGKKPK